MLAAILLALPGFAALALAMERHQRDLLGRRLTGRATLLLRGLGWLLLAASPLEAIARQGWGMGLVVWLGALTLAAAAVLLALSASLPPPRPAGRGRKPG